ncbi:hypothetical protein ANN_15778 [Periplaneta americana]|uniref:Protein TKR n=1 Tax=Periplaneta americana TaxID=6978 RepID=A0ABQ8SI61_PERAM|nr:hypothetical protein ANN_15778 [Periplaneta americana]
MTGLCEDGNESPDSLKSICWWVLVLKEDMATPHYSLRWNNHQNHILNAFDTLLQSETLVDVTLVCEETSVRAHKVVLSACSPYFQRIFSENPCKHPVIVLKDLRGWEVQAIVDFMYKGEISVVQEQLSSLIKAAESLQVRGLAHTEQQVLPEKEQQQQQQQQSQQQSSQQHQQQLHSSAHSAGFSPPPPLSSLEKLGLYSTPTSTSRNFAGAPASDPAVGLGAGLPMLSPFSPSPIPNYEPPLKLPQLPHMPHISFSENPPPPSIDHRTSPQPRRKQARPRRRSGDQCGAQDLTKPPASPLTETAENLSMKKPLHQHHNSSSSNNNSSNTNNNISSNGNITPAPTLPPAPPGTPVTSPHPLDPTLENSGFPQLPSVSALTMTPPHVFSLDAQLGFFPGMESCRNPLLNDIPEPRNENHHIIGKRKSVSETPAFLTGKMAVVSVGRPKGQHSAPRGGPPRSWTNAELTEALQHVWNKKMTTSQASRIFGIPYNSLLMYVRGKYGKSLKLEQLKKDCLGGPGGPLELLGLGPMGPVPGNNNNNNNNASSKSGAGDELLVPPGSEHDLVSVGPGGFNPYSPANFYPDFGASFPVPVSMIHLLPQSEKNRELFPPSMPLPLDVSAHSKDDSNGGRRSRENNGSMEEEHESIQQQQHHQQQQQQQQQPPKEDTTTQQLVEQNGQN